MPLPRQKQAPPGQATRFNMAYCRPRTANSMASASHPGMWYGYGGKLAARRAADLIPGITYHNVNPMNYIRDEIHKQDPGVQVLVLLWKSHSFVSSRRILVDGERDHRLVQLSVFTAQYQFQSHCRAKPHFPRPTPSVQLSLSD